jgi:aryl-alcohol dehydrogenase-like predicted oxidoreductase
MEKMRRREFLAGSLAGAGAMLLGTRLVLPEETKTEMFDPFELVSLGKTGLKVSRVGAGTGAHGGDHRSNQTRLGKEKFEALVRAEYDKGIRMFDMADMYGTHPFVGAALKALPRDKYVLVSKIGTWHAPEDEREKPDVSVQRFLREIGTDYIDLVLLHCVMSGDWPKQLRKYMDGLAELKKKGVIRAHGVSCHSIPALEAALNDPWVDSVHARINAFGVEMDDEADKVTDVLKKIRQAGKGVVGMKLVGNGEFKYDQEKIDKSVEYVLTKDCVDMMIVGFEDSQEVDDFAGRVRKVAKKPA